MKCLFAAIALLLALAFPQSAKAQFNGCLPGFCIPQISTAGTTCAQSASFIARTHNLDVTHITAYDTLICGLVSDGVWTKLDYLHTFATQDQTTANLNLVSTTFTIAPQGSPAPAWTLNRGYTGVGGSTGTYLFNGFVPLTGGGNIFTTNNGHIAAWSNTSAQHVSYMESDFGGTGAGFVIIQPRNVSNNTLYFLNSLSGISVANTDGSGFYAANMSGGNTLDAYRNGSSVGTLSVAATASWGGPLPLLAIGYFPGQVRDGTDAQISGASAGGALTPTDHANLYARMHAFMITMGIP